MMEARGGACDARDGEDGPKRLCPGCDVGLTVQAKLDAELASVFTKFSRVAPSRLQGRQVSTGTLRDAFGDQVDQADEKS